MTTLEERVAAIEQRLTAGPLAAPPATIGELTNVPAPGSPITSAWAQDVSARVVQRFPNFTALNAYAAPNGAVAAVINGPIYYRVGGAWRLTPYVGRYALPAGNIVVGAGTTQTILSVVTAAFPAAWLVKVSYTWVTNHTGANAYNITFGIGGASVLNQHNDGSANKAQTFVTWAPSTGATIPLTMSVNNWGTGTVTMLVSGTGILVEAVPES